MNLTTFKKINSILLITVFVATNLLYINNALAENSPPPTEVKDYSYNFSEINNIKPDVKTLTTDLMGDKISPSTGSISFEQTDISIPGNSSLPVAITRTLSDADSWHRETLDFENWSLSIPHVRSSYVTDKQDDYKGAYWPNGNACTAKLNSNPTFSRSVEGNSYHGYPESYWNGDTVSIPGYGSVKLTEKSGSVTRYNNRNWKVECITTTGGYDGFKITLPNGDRYTFAQQRVVKSIKPFNLSPYIDLAPCGSLWNGCPMQSVGPPSDPVVGAQYNQYFIFMLATKVEDKFGNWVKYQYNAEAKLEKISANDNRVIDINYTQGRISSIVSNGKTWAYTYDDDKLKTLKTVTLPDSKTWDFNHDKNSLNSFWIYSNISQHSQLPYHGFQCIEGGGSRNFITITHPEGMKADFTLSEVCHGKSGVAKIPKPNPNRYDYDTYWLPAASSVYSLKNKTLTFADGRVYNWQYSYSNNEGLYKNAAIKAKHRLPFSVAGVETAHLNSTTVINPDNSKAIQYFDRKSGPTAGNLLYHETYNKLDQLQKRITYSYQNGIFHGKAKTYAFIQNSSVNWSEEDIETGHSASQQQRTIAKVEDYVTLSDRYTTTYSEFDVYDKAAITAEFNNINGNKRYTKKLYQHEPSSHLFGFPKSTSVSTNGNNYTTVNETVYHNNASAGGVYNSYLLPYQKKQFGRVIQSFPSYHLSGSFAGKLNKLVYHAPLSVGAGNRFYQFENYYRGIARTIHTPQRNSSSLMSFIREVDAEGNITRITDLNGIQTFYHYDLAGRLQSVKSPNDSVYGNNWLDTLFVWTTDTENNPVRTIKRCTLNPQGNACSSTPVLSAATTYDSLFRPMLEVTTDNVSTIYKRSRYDENSQLAFASFPSTHDNATIGTTHSYDGLRRKVSTATYGAGVVEHKYLAGNKIEVIDAGKNANNIKHSTITTYLAYGSPSYEQATKIESPESVTTDINVNIFGNVTSITQTGSNGESSTQTNLYNDLQQQCMVRRTDVGNTFYNYNNLNQVTWQAEGVSGTNCASHSARADQKTSLSYDNQGSQQHISYGDGTPTRTFGLDNNGNIKTITGQGFSQSYHYNSLNLLEDETLSIAGRSGNITLDYGYDSLGNSASLKYPDGLEAINFAPNAFGQATQAIRSYTDGTAPDVFVKGGSEKASYYPSGSINTFTYGNNIVHKTTLNSRLMPAQITDKLGTSDRVNLSYEYDNNNNITKLTNTRNAGIYSLSSLTYDGLDRLKTTTGGLGIGSSAMSYDGLGNILTYSNNSAYNAHSLSYGYTNNRLTSVSGAGSTGYNFNRADSYDTRGNVTHNGKRGFDYNLANQMTSSGNNRFVYDGYNRRVKSVKDNGKTEYSMYSQAGKLLYRETEQGGINYISLGSKLVAKEGTGVVSSGGSVTNYKPFGESIETPKDDVGYTGHKFDKDLGLSYMQARYYDPVIGRFYSNDPVGFIGNPHSFNRYAYVNNNPYKYTDPTGMLAQGDSARCAGSSDCRFALDSDSGESMIDSVPAEWGKTPSDNSGQPSNGEVSCSTSCQKTATDISFAHATMAREIRYRQTQGLLLAATPMLLPAVAEGAIIAGAVASENAAAAIIATNLFSTMAGDLATLTAFALRKEAPVIMQSLLKSGRWGKPKTKSLSPLRPKEVITP